MVALCLVGLFCIPKLRIQYLPEDSGDRIEVSFNWPDASPEALEAEVTARVEGVLSALPGVNSVSSLSRRGSGRVILQFDNGYAMDKARFRVSSALRNLYPSLPQGVSYPVTRITGRQSQSVGYSLLYTVRADWPTRELARLATFRIKEPLSALSEVDGVSVSGASPYQWVVTFDAGRLEEAGLSPENVSAALQNSFEGGVVGMGSWEGGQVRLLIKGREDVKLGSIPVGKVNGRIYYLSDIASWRYEEAEPEHYYRINGQNTITLAVTLSSSAHLLDAAREIRGRMEGIAATLPGEVRVDLSYDASEYVRKELRRIYLRTGLCLLLLLLFVLLASGSVRYLLVISSTLAVNILLAIALYAALKIPIHIYSLAGITVSLGLVMDTSIVMADHYAKWKDRRVFPALFAATATSLVALVLVLLLPRAERENLTDFILVIGLNLALSLVVAWLFIPALMHYLPVGNGQRRLFPGRIRWKARWNRFYGNYIKSCTPWRWMFAGVVLAFFIWTGYRFLQVIDRSSFFRQPQRPELYIRAGMPEGCTVEQMNQVMGSMERYLMPLEGIESFVTSITGPGSGMITVRFKPEYATTAYPMQLKSNVIEAAINFGGASWQVYGIDDRGFNNNVASSYKMDGVALEGYSYTELLGYAKLLKNHLAGNPRVAEPEILTPESRMAASEWNLEYDFSQMVVLGINPYQYYKALSSLLWDRPVMTIWSDDGPSALVLRSSERENYDRWHLLNVPAHVDSTQLTLSEVGELVKRRSGLDIYRENQSYHLEVRFDYVGSSQLRKRFMDETLEFMNQSILPVGYKATDTQGYWNGYQRQHYYWLIAIILAAVFVLLAIALESLKLPLAIISIIPVSFTGVFLIFAFSDYSFDQGGFAALVMLSGLVVNAGIYLISAWKHWLPSGTGNRKLFSRSYLLAFREKYRPILLTTLSTVLGLLPFLSDGPQEVFWFDFALGTIVGLVFSVLGLLALFPLLVVGSRR